MIVGLLVLPLGMTSLVENNWNHGEEVCKFWISVDYLSFSVLSLLTIVLMVDRMFAKLKPNLMTGPKGKLIGFGFILAPWLIPSIIGLPLVLQSIVLIELRTSSWCMLIFKSELAVTGVALLNITPMLLMICVTVGTCFSFRNYGIQWYRMDETGTGSTSDEQQRELKLKVVASCTVGCTTAVLWIPFIVLIAIFWLCRFPNCIINYTTHVAVYMTSITSYVIPPILWIVILPELRIRVRTMFSGLVQKVGHCLPVQPHCFTANDKQDTGRLYKVTYEVSD